MRHCPDTGGLVEERYIEVRGVLFLLGRLLATLFLAVGSAMAFVAFLGILMAFTVVVAFLQPLFVVLAFSLSLVEIVLEDLVLLGSEDFLHLFVELLQTFLHLALVFLTLFFGLLLELLLTLLLLLVEVSLVFLLHGVDLGLLLGSEGDTFEETVLTASGALCARTLSLDAFPFFGLFGSLHTFLVRFLGTTLLLIILCRSVEAC